MPHHLGYALNWYSCAKAHRSEGVASHVERQPFLNAASLSYNAQVLAHYTAAAIAVEDKAVAFFFHCLPFFIILLFFLQW